MNIMQIFKRKIEQKILLDNNGVINEDLIRSLLDGVIQGSGGVIDPSDVQEAVDSALGLALGEIDFVTSNQLIAAIQEELTDLGLVATPHSLKMQASELTLIANADDLTLPQLQEAAQENKIVIASYVDALVALGGGELEWPECRILVPAGIYLDALSTNLSTRATIKHYASTLSDIFTLARGTWIEPVENGEIMRIRCPRTVIDGFIFDGRHFANRTERNALVHLVVGDGAQWVPSPYNAVEQAGFHQDCARVQVLRNEFRRGGVAGLMYKDGQNLICKQNRFYECDGPGIFCPGGYFDNNHAHYEDNSFSYNGHGILSSERPYIEFTVSDVDTNTFYAPGHAFITARSTGLGPTDEAENTFDVRGGFTLPTGLSAGVEYYTIRVDADHFRLAATQEDSFNGVAIDVSDVGVGYMEIRYNHYTSNTTTFTGENKFYDKPPYNTYGITVASQTDNTLTVEYKKRYTTGDGPVRVYSTGNVPTGLSKGVDYWVIDRGPNLISLASSKENALAKTAIDITSNGTGTMTIDDYASALEIWGDSWGRGGTAFLESNKIGVIIRESSSRCFFTFDGDNSNASPGNMHIADRSVHEISGVSPAYGRIRDYVKARYLEITGSGTAQYGAMMFMGSNANLYIQGTQAGSGRFVVNILKGSMGVAGLKLGDIGGAIFGISRARYTAVAIPDIAAGGTYTVSSLTLDGAVRDNFAMFVSCSNGNARLKQGLVLSPVRTTVDDVAANTAVAFDIHNFTSATITAHTVRFTLMGFNLGSSGWE